MAARFFRNLGQGLEELGLSLQAIRPSSSRPVCTKNVMYNNTHPAARDALFVAPSASVVGNVELGSNSSVWYGAVVRGDVNSIKIGEGTAILDRACVHAASERAGKTGIATVIGSGVTVGPGAVVHAATLHDACVIGPSAHVLDGATVETHAIVSAGAVVTPGTKVGSRELWAGNPAKKERDLTAAEAARIGDDARRMSELAARHEEECSKSAAALAADKAAASRHHWYFQSSSNEDEDVPYQPLLPPQPERRGMLFDRKL